MVSDSELIDRLREFLRNSDLDTTTTGIVRRKLEEDFGVDLSDKKQFIREQVDLFLQSEQERAEDGDEDGDDPDDNLKAEENELSEDEEEEASNGSKTGSNKPSKEVKKRGGGFCKLCSLSPQLQEVLGAPEMARTEVVKQLWNHIREKDLQDPSNRRNILCDEPLKSLFGVNSINMFQMNKALSKHIWPLDSNDVIPTKSTQKEKDKEKEKQKKEKPQKLKKVKPQKRPKQEKEEDSDESAREEKRQKKGKSGFLAPLQLSDALITFLGTGENALSRADVVKRMWDYIKQNNLQDPSDKRRIICDEKLKELFDVDSFHGFTVSKLLVAHFVKTK